MFYFLLLYLCVYFYLIWLFTYLILLTIAYIHTCCCWCCKISNIVSDPDQNCDVLHCVNVEAEIGKHFTTMGSATLVCGKYPDWPRSLRCIKAIDVTQAVAPRELLSGISLRIVPQGWISVRNKAMDWNERERERVRERRGRKSEVKKERKRDRKVMVQLRISNF